MAVAKIFDGISDVIFGFLIDKTHTKMGKARPWMLWPYFGCGVCLFAIFAIPTSWVRLHSMPSSSSSTWS